MYIFQADLLTLDKIQRRYNSSYKYILLCIYYAYVILLRSQRGDEVDRALESVFELDSYRKKQTDWDSVFVNPHVKKFLLKYNIILYHSFSPIKVALVERMIRKIRLLIPRYCILKKYYCFCSRFG